MLREVDNKIGISKERYKLFFSMENSYGIFRLKDNTEDYKSYNYECVNFFDHDCVFPSEVLIDILLHMRSGNYLFILPGDIVSICINGILYSYRFCGVTSWNPDNIEDVFEDMGTSFFNSEKKKIINRLHESGMVLDVLKGNVISLKEKSDLKRYNFYGIEKETYSFKPFNFVSEYNIYRLKDGKITNINPNDSSFYNISHVLLYYMKRCQNEKYSVLLFNRKELEMIKDCMDINNGIYR